VYRRQVNYNNETDRLALEKTWLQNKKLHEIFQMTFSSILCNIFFMSKLSLKGQKNIGPTNGRKGNLKIIIKASPKVVEPLMRDRDRPSILISKE
jgi:hypothetical protein